MEDQNKTYSVALRLRKIIHEDAFVSIPVTDAIMKKKEDGSMGIDMAALVAEAIKISENQNVDWQVETLQKEPHPIQTPKPENRKVFHPYQNEK